MKLITLYLFAAISAVQANAQNINNTKPKKNTIKITGMKTTLITNSTVLNAISALQNEKKERWFSLFTSNAELFDDGREVNLKRFFEKALGHEKFTSIDKVENGSMDIFGKFHSDQWGDFKTYFKFRLNGQGKIERLEIGQASY